MQDLVKEYGKVAKDAVRTLFLQRSDEAQTLVDNAHTAKELYEALQRKDLMKEPVEKPRKKPRVSKEEKSLEKKPAEKAKTYGLMRSGWR